ARGKASEWSCGTVPKGVGLSGKLSRGARTGHELGSKMKGLVTRLWISEDRGAFALSRSTCLQARMRGRLYRLLRVPPRRHVALSLIGTRTWRRISHFGLILSVAVPKRFTAVVAQAQASAGSRNVARSDVPTGMYVLNVLPFTDVPEKVSIIRLTVPLHQRPSTVDLAECGTFVRPAGGLELWSFVPFPIL